MCSRSTTCDQLLGVSGMSLVHKRLIHQTNRLMWFQNAIPADCPSFRISADKIRIIREPVEFYNLLKEKSRQSKDRITMSSLYIGTGPKERQLVQAVDHALRSSSQLRATFLFDYTRGTRKDESNESSSDMLKNLVSDRSRVSFFLSPKFSSFLLKRFLLPVQKKNEIISLQHMKCFVFDNDVIVSGANLSDQYFENRSDRYFLFKDCPELADYFDDLVKTVASFSLSLSESGDFYLNDSMQYHPLASSDRSSFVQEAKSRITQFKHRHNGVDDISDCQTSVTPLLQMHEFGINDDMEFTVKLLSSIPDRAIVRLSSGYFNLTKRYQDILLSLSNRVSTDVLMASEKVNSFYDAKGLLGYVPSMYSAVSRRFFQQIQSSGSSLRLWSFYRPQWTFHTKGVWIKTQDGVVVSTVGSSNFGCRSVYKDLELQVLIATRDRDLQARLEHEHESIWKHADRVNSISDFPHVSLWLTFASKWIKGFF